MNKIRLYKILPVADGLKNWGKVHEALFEPILSPDVEVTQVELPHAPIKSIGGAYHTEMVAMLQVAEAIRGEQLGYDAVVLGCLDEPGLPAAKEVLAIPAVGEAEAAMHYASLVGRRFSFLANSSGGNGVLEDLVRKYGFLPKLASIRIVPGYPLDFSAPSASLQQAVLAQARLAIDEDGADAIIGYGGIELISFLQTSLNLPVISPIQASVIMAESLVRLRLRQSKKAFPWPVDLEKSGLHKGATL